MYKIGGFSKITKLTVKTLRYYDEENIAMLESILVRYMQQLKAMLMVILLIVTMIVNTERTQILRHAYQSQN